jgi:hypothetical protein
MIRWCVGNQRLDGGCGPQRRPSPLAAAFDELVGRIAAGSVRWSRGGTPELWCWGCWLTCHARTAGRSPSTPGTPPRTAREHLLARAVWDHDAVRDDVRAYLVDHLGDPAAVLVVDETGISRKAPPRSGWVASTARMGEQDALGLGLTLASTGFVPHL